MRIMALLLMCWLFSAPVSLPVAVAAEIDFDTQIIPLLTRFGCNVGACHGAAAGRGGLQLSLYGSRPAADHEALSLQLEGRRVNLVTPAESLLLWKATGQADHGGDVRFEQGSDAAERLFQWIEQGARREIRWKLKDLQITSANEKVTEFKLAVHATFEKQDRNRSQDETDSTVEYLCSDVTAWTVLTAQDPAVVSVSADGRVVCNRPGQHLVIARFMDRVTPIQLAVPRTSATPAVETADITAADGRPLSAIHFIDQELERKLALLRIPVSPAADDSMFLRRVHLDLTGQLPAPDHTERFIEDTDPEKRMRMVDQLTSSDAFTDYWTYRMAVLLRLGSSGSKESIASYSAWLHSAIRDGVPLNRLFEQLLMAEGNPAVEGPPNFYLTGRDPREQGEFFSEALLGIRLRCANCHDHPLDLWTQDDYHGLAAIFAGVERQENVQFSGRGSVIHPVTGLPAVPRIPGERFLDPVLASANASSSHSSSQPALTTDGRAELFRWITSPRTPWLARSIVNRVWKQLMGRGLIEPVDDLRITNPATHPELLEALTAEFTDSGYNLRRLIRTICRSDAYERSSRTLPENQFDHQFYSHAIVRPIEPAVLLDAICEVTGVPDPSIEAAAAAAITATPGNDRRAVSQANPRAPSEALDVLGRCSDVKSCDAGSTGQGDLSVLLHLINGRLLNQKLSAPENRLTQLLSKNVSDDALLTQLYLLTCCRSPTEAEQQFWQLQLAAARMRGDFRETVEDLLWTLLTSAEFRERR